MDEEGFDSSIEAVSSDENIIFEENGDMDSIPEIQDGLEGAVESPPDIEQFTATPLTEQMVIEENGDINSIASIQERLEAGENTEPYLATPLSEQMVIEENGEIGSIQDIMERLEQKDLQEVSNDMNTEAPFEKAFADMIDAMSLDEMKMERDKLIALGALDGEGIAGQYEAFKVEQKEQQHFDAMTDGLNADQLKGIKEKLQAGDQQMLDLLGSDDTSEGEGAQKVKRR